MKRHVAVTFDLDLFSPGKKFADSEFDLFWPFFQKCCLQIPKLKTTWFLRIDNQMGSLFGKQDFIFSKYNKQIQWLKEHGHEIGWHFHSYIKMQSKWKQNSNESAICDEILESAKYAQQYELNSVRMGWGYHTNRTMKTLESLKFKIDCSALPKPNYQNEKSIRDWTTTPTVPYYPSETDYRVSGMPNFKILEIPITMVHRIQSTDVELNMLRPLNPIWNSVDFRNLLPSDLQIPIVTISHPIELFSHAGKGTKTESENNNFLTNLKQLEEDNFTFSTISNIGKNYF